ncbi:multiple sugar transport system permease protein [Microbacterium resistens]|uniref:Multiple sugar transport system permease protein n=1 Tax=Microbacterium resistens TaxID=156977 RepID=A0ABU1SDY5_9MICO|nr:sugar ABC transporter permease [Microbacterium resistens]MDR6867453.1 multiple sugar transport system permease protein [Microbacterium resistens]
MSQLHRTRRRGSLTALLVALPALLVFAVFSWWPILRGLVMSVQKTNFVGPAEWVGWSNFAYVLGDPLLGAAVLNTLLFALLAILFGFPLPLALAVVISTVSARRRGLYAGLAYLPVIVPPVVAILLWKFAYDPGATGLFNAMLSGLGIGPLPWLNSASLAMPSIVLQATWAGAGTSVLIYLAALTAVRPELYEAAMLDGAGIWRRVWTVTLPQIRGIVLVMLLLQLIGAAQVFTEPFLMTGGGPQNATTTVLLLMYRYAFGGSADYGAATALGVLLAIVLALLSFLYLRLTRRWGS